MKKKITHIIGWFVHKLLLFQPICVIYVPGFAGLPPFAGVPLIVVLYVADAPAVLGFPAAACIPVVTVSHLLLVCLLLQESLMWLRPPNAGVSAVADFPACISVVCANAGWSNWKIPSAGGVHVFAGIPAIAWVITNAIVIFAVDTILFVVAGFLLLWASLLLLLFLLCVTFLWCFPVHCGVNDWLSKWLSPICMGPLYWKFRRVFVASFTNYY
jgi:hypothetical protein